MNETKTLVEAGNMITLESFLAAVKIGLFAFFCFALIIKCFNALYGFSVLIANICEAIDDKIYEHKKRIKAMQKPKKRDE